MIQDLLFHANVSAAPAGNSGVFVKPYVGNVVTNTGYAIMRNFPNAYDGDLNTSADIVGQYGGSSVLRYTFDQVLPAGSRLTVKYKAAAVAPKTSYDILSVDPSLSNKMSLISDHNSGNTSVKTLSCILPQDTKAIDFQVDYIYYTWTSTEGLWILDISVEL